MKPTKLINLWGGPGSGKSTLAADVFATFKKQGKNVELVTEYAKSFAWEGKKITSLDQIQIAASQSIAEERLIGKVEYVVTDSPSLLGAFYDEFYNGSSVVTQMLLALRARRKDRFVSEVDLFLQPRIVGYSSVGRFESADAAESISYSLLRWLCNNHVYAQQLQAPTVEEVSRYLSYELPPSGAFLSRKPEHE